MKKYYLQDTAEELKIGDMIQLDFTEDKPNSHVKVYSMEVKFIPPLIPLLIEQGVVCVKEVKEKKPSQPCTTASDIIKGLIGKTQALEERVESLTQMVKEMILLLAYTPNPPINKPKHKKNASKAGRE